MENTLPIEIKLDEHNFPNILEMIVLGKHYKEIAERYNSTIYKLFQFLHSPQFSARVREAKEYAAHCLVDEAENVIAQAYAERNKPGGMIAYLAAKELAHHYRWKASMINRVEYASKKVEVMVDAPTGKDKYIIEIVEDDGEASKD